MLRLAIIGSRDFNDYNLVKSTLEKYKDKISIVVSGGANGADSLGERWAIDNGIETLIFPAEWDKYGKRAGYIRNQTIIQNCDCVIAFWNGESKGTNHSINLANKNSKPVKIVYIK